MRWKQCVMSFQKQNLRYIEERCRCRVFAEASWSGVQNGITFTITHPQVSGIQEAEQLLNGILRKVGIRFQRTKNKQSGIKGKEWSDQSWRNLEKTSIWPVDFINIEMKFIYVFRWKKNCRDTFKHWKYHQMVSKNTKKNFLSFRRWYKLSYWNILFSWFHIDLLAAVTLEHSISSVVCGTCKERLVSSLKVNYLRKSKQTF